jgi:hypothetical protein
VKQIPDNTFDLLFIDADHQYESIKQDIADWIPKVKSTGMIAGHDYFNPVTGALENQHPGVKRAVDEAFPRIRVGGHVWSRQAGHHITVSLCTKGRYTTTLPVAMASLVTQTRLPDYVYIYDDNSESEWVDMRDIPVIKHILQTYDRKGIEWYIIYGHKKGQHYGDQVVNQKAKSLVIRFDDDALMEPNVLEELEKAMTDDVGAVGCSIIDPSNVMEGVSTGKLKNLRMESNMQWVRGQGDVEHLHGCFLYRSHVADFDLSLSPRSFRGETMFSHEIFRKGYRLKVINNCTIWHYQNRIGGNRSEADEQKTKEYYANDENIFNQWLKRIEVGINQRVAIINEGLGDSIVFRKWLENHEIRDCTIFAAHPEVFQGYKVLSIGEAQQLKYDLEKYSAYSWANRMNFNRPFYEVYDNLYRELWGIQ